MRGRQHVCVCVRVGVLCAVSTRARRETRASLRCNQHSAQPAPTFLHETRQHQCFVTEPCARTSPCSGADAILLIASVLPNQDLLYFSKAAGSLGMQCLIEVCGPAALG